MMLNIDGERRETVPLHEFQAKWSLPESFRAEHFEPKTEPDLGSIAGPEAGNALTMLKREVLDALPPVVPLEEFIVLAEQISQRFDRQLRLANVNWGLRPVEIDFAVAGFADVLKAVGFALMRLKVEHGRELAQIREAFDFWTVYQQWLDDGTRVSIAVYLYKHAGQQFTVRMVNNPYGRVALEVQTVEGLEYVADSSLACPAANYMGNLLHEIVQRLCDRLA